MTITVLSQTREDYVELTGSGEFSMSAAIDLLSHSLEFAIEQNRAAALIDVTNVKGEPDQLERFELGRIVPEEQLARGKLVSLALVSSQPILDRNRLIELVAVNRCAVFKAFDNSEKAIAWLKDNTTKTA